MASSRGQITLAPILRILSALLSKLYEAECLTHVDMEKSPVLDQPQHMGVHDKLHEQFSKKHRMPTLVLRISVSCFDILDSMSGRGGAKEAKTDAQV